MAFYFANLISFTDFNSDLMVLWKIKFDLYEASLPFQGKLLGVCIKLLKRNLVELKCQVNM